MNMAEGLDVEGETFTAIAPLNESRRPGLETKVTFVEDASIKPFLTEDALREEELWAKKVKDAQGKGRTIYRGFQYGSDGNLGLTPQQIFVPVSPLWYSRIELAKELWEKHQRRVSNVLAISQVTIGPNGYLFAERGGKVAYHGGTSQLHALVAGNYPQQFPALAGNYPQQFPALKPEDMTPERWLDIQQEAEHAIKPSEISRRMFLGLVEDKTLGYKPDLAYVANSAIGLDELGKRAAPDAWEKKGVMEFPATEAGLIKVLLEHQGIKRHVPPGFGAAVLQLARVGGVEALERLNSEGRQGGAPVVTYRISAVV